MKKEDILIRLEELRWEYIRVGEGKKKFIVALANAFKDKLKDIEQDSVEINKNGD